jgi:ankyrin repeat protein
MMPPTLWKASSMGFVAEVQAALERGEEVDSRGGELNSTGLMEAAMNGHEGVVSLLLERGAVVNAVDGIVQQTALHYADSPGVVRILLAQPGVDCNPRDTYGETPIVEAVSGGMVECVRVLAWDPRVELDSTNGQGTTLEELARGPERWPERWPETLAKSMADILHILEAARDGSCPVCYKLMTPPMQIFGCGNGHKICGVCRPRLQDQRCPSCRRPLLPLSARVPGVW